jgi:hypothetical protein
MNIGETRAGVLGGTAPMVVFHVSASFSHLRWTQAFGLLLSFNRSKDSVSMEVGAVLATLTGVYTDDGLWNIS